MLSPAITQISPSFSGKAVAGSAAAKGLAAVTKISSTNWRWKACMSFPWSSGYPFWMVSVFEADRFLPGTRSFPIVPAMPNLGQQPLHFLELLGACFGQVVLLGQIIRQVKELRG